MRLGGNTWRRELAGHKAARAGNQAATISRSRRLTESALLFVSGMLTSTAFPSLNWSIIIWIGLVPLYLVCVGKTPARAWRGGFIWGYGFSVCAFFWFREIEFFLPYLVAVVLALFPACWAWALPLLHRGLCIPPETHRKGYAAVSACPEPGYLTRMFCAISMASWWCAIEWLRGWIFTGLPWNDLAAAQWRNLVLIQICEYTGTYGVSFIIALVNITAGMAIAGFAAGMRDGRPRRPYALISALALLVIVCAVGLTPLRRHATVSEPAISFRPALLQGDISQRRHADREAAEEALNKYLDLSRKAAAANPDIIVWPETAVPYPFRANHPTCLRYRAGVAEISRKHNIPFLIGTIDYENLPPGTQRQPLFLNSALLVDGTPAIRGQFDKVHLVPFGEFVPFRNYLPDFIIRIIDMGRDLGRGSSLIPLEIFPGVRAGINICFEDIFAYIARAEALAGANLLVVLTNDAWYPRSAEPEQHLANSVFRAVETRLPMIRCGNNSATCLIMPNGQIADSIFKTADKDGREFPDIARRGEGIAIFNVKVPASPETTFHTRYGNVFIAACLTLLLAAAGLSLWNWRSRREKLATAFDDPTSSAQ